MAFAKVDEGGQVTEFARTRDELPQSMQYEDGRTVSNANLATAVQLRELGWWPAQEIYPDPFDPATEELEAPVFAIVGTEVHATYGKRARTEEELRPERIGEKVSARIEALENATATKAGWDALTAAQRQEITRQALYAVAKLARLVLSKFDVPEN